MTQSDPIIHPFALPQRGVRPVERAHAAPEARAFYDEAENRFGDLLNVFKVLGHQPEYGQAFTDTVLAILKDGVLSWRTKELLILKTTCENACRYCLVQHERVAEMLEVAPGKIAALEGDGYRSSPHFTAAERSLLDLCMAMCRDATDVPAHVWRALRRHWSEAEIVDAAFVVSFYTAVSRFVDALGVPLEEKFQDARPQLKVAS